MAKKLPSFEYSPKQTTEVLDRFNNEMAEQTMSGEKTTTTDEFLIKKKDPLVLPPDYGELPLPKSNKKKSQQDSIETVLRSNDNTKNETKTSSDLENIILRELNK